MYIFILMFECEPCGFCHVLVGFELICFRFMLSMAWSSTCFQTSTTHFTLFSTIILSPVAYLPTHSPIPHSLTSVQPACSPHDIPLLILSCIFHSHVHAILTASFLSLHRVMHPFVFLQRPQPLFCTPSQPMLVPPRNPYFHPHFHTHATNLSYPLITH